MPEPAFLSVATIQTLAPMWWTAMHLKPVPEKSATTHLALQEADTKDIGSRNTTDG